VKTERNHFTLDFDGKMLTIRLNGKLVVEYTRPDLSKPVRDELFLCMELLIIGPPPDIKEKESFEVATVGFQIPSRGRCTICGRDANLLGGLCYDCCQQPA